MCYLEKVLLFLSSAVVEFCVVINSARIKSMGIYGETGTKQLEVGEWEPAMLSGGVCS